MDVSLSQGEESAETKTADLVLEHPILLDMSALFWPTEAISYST